MRDAVSTEAEPCCTRTVPAEICAAHLLCQGAAMHVLGRVKRMCGHVGQARKGLLHAIDKAGHPQCMQNSLQYNALQYTPDPVARGSSADTCKLLYGSGMAAD